jgi:sulfate adenylyltransferase/3'-phosphoadenosine 5'-phosphosulfate synthase
MSGFVIWFTGLSGSGKSTLAAMLGARLKHYGIHTEVLDGDVVRKNLSKGLGFSKEDRDTNIRRIGFVASLVANSGGCAITAAISPYKDIRDEQRDLVDNFVEVFCDCPLDELVKRDPKGLYKKALAGEITGFTGVNDPYETPTGPEVVVHTMDETPEESLNKILDKLIQLGLLSMTNKQQGLVAPHGGTLINRQQELKINKQNPFIDLSEQEYCDLQMIGNGAFSPLTGFMNQKDYLKVVNEMRLENGLPWTIPITLATTSEHAASLQVGNSITLRYEGFAVGYLNLSDIYAPDKENECQKVFGTTDMDHPGVTNVMTKGMVYLGGDVGVAPGCVMDSIGSLPSSPKQTREMFQHRGWTKVVAFQTRNPMHRAHEYLTKCALEICDGLLIHPLTGATKEDDIPANIRNDCYRALIDNYYPEGTVILAEFPAAMRYAGPREAIHHAICRKNYGCSHFIVGRDHAGVGNYYGTYDAQKIFDEFAPGELGITPLCFEHTFYSKTLKGMGSSKTAPGGTETKVFLSGTKVREMLKNGEDLPEEFTRPEVAEVLKKAYQSE